MGQWRFLIHLGDFELVLPLAAAIAAWLAGARAWRLAFWWCLLFGLAASLVGVSKIAYMGWGGGMPALAFKSFSGHAAGVAAVLPMLCYLMLPDRPWRRLGLAAGLLLAAVVALLLVLLDEHTVAEALAGAALGATASLGSVGLASAGPSSRPPRALLWSALAFGTLFCMMSSVPVGYWMIKAARALSGSHQLYPLSME